MKEKTKNILKFILKLINEFLRYLIMSKKDGLTKN